MFGLLGYLLVFGAGYWLGRRPDGEEETTEAAELAPYEPWQVTRAYAPPGEEWFEPDDLIQAPPVASAHPEYVEEPPHPEYFDGPPEDVVVVAARDDVELTDAVRGIENWLQNFADMSDGTGPSQQILKPSILELEQLQEMSAALGADHLAEEFGAMMLDERVHDTDRYSIFGDMYDAWKADGFVNPTLIPDSSKVLIPDSLGAP